MCYDVVAVRAELSRCSWTHPATHLIFLLHAAVFSAKSPESRIDSDVRVRHAVCQMNPTACLSHGSTRRRTPTPSLRQQTAVTAHAVSQNTERPPDCTSTLTYIYHLFIYIYICVYDLFIYMCVYIYHLFNIYMSVYIQYIYIWYIYLYLDDICIYICIYIWFIYIDI